MPQNTSLSSSTSVSSVPNAAVGMLLQAETQNIRFTLDGTTPTASVGMILVAGGAPIAIYAPPATLKFIEVSASAKLNYEYLYA